MKDGHLSIEQFCVYLFHNTDSEYGKLKIVIIEIK